MTTALIIVGVIIVLAIVVYFVSETDWAQRVWDDWFHDSETILWGYLQGFGGLVIGGLNAMSWGPLLDTGLTAMQRWTAAGILFAQGVVTVLARKFRATDM